MPTKYFPLDYLAVSSSLIFSFYKNDAESDALSSIFFHVQLIKSLIHSCNFAFSFPKLRLWGLRLVYFRKAACSVMIKDNKPLKHRHVSSVISCGDALRTFSGGVSLGDTFLYIPSRFFHALRKTKQYHTQLAHGTLVGSRLYQDPGALLLYVQGYSVHSFQIH